MSDHFARALVLFQQSRPDLAQSELRQLLTEEPDHPLGHAFLSLCLTDEEKFDEATREAQMAVHLAPDASAAHYALAYVMKHRNRLKEAREAIDEAIRLDPEDVDLFSLLASLEFEERNWDAALRAAERGLQLNPQSANCRHLRAMALVHLGRKDEATSTLDETLARNPENAWTHANKGWTCLHTGATRQALEHFQEALRIEPDLEAARAGMVEALKARNFIYRWLLSYFLWMSRLSRKGQWTVIVGGWFGYKVIRELARTQPKLAPYLYPLICIYILFVILTWIADPLFNTFLRFSRFGRLALSRQQTVVSNALVICLLVIAGSIVVYALTNNGAALIAGLCGLMLMIPVTATLKQGPGWPRKVLTAYTVFLACCAVISVTLVAGVFENTLSEDARFIPVLICILGSATFSWVANALNMVRVKR